MDELCRLFALAREHGVPFTVLGRGSNVLIDDAGIPGLVVVLRKSLMGLSVDEEQGWIIAEGGSPLPRIAVTAEKHGFAGLEFLAGIPGTVGAGVAINAGIGPRGGRSLRDVLVSASVLDSRSGEVREVDAEVLGLAYRSSRIPAHGLWVLSATLRADGREPAPAIRARRQALIEARSAKQPLQSYTSGSVFKQPDGGHPAGWYIDRCGLKGKQIGGVRVSPKHANWIENDGTGTAAAVRQLMSLVQGEVHRRFGVVLEREVRFLPEDLVATYHSTSSYADRDVPILPLHPEDGGRP